MYNSAVSMLQQWLCLSGCLPTVSSQRLQSLQSIEQKLLLLTLQGFCYTCRVVCVYRVSITACVVINQPRRAAGSDGMSALLELERLQYLLQQWL